MAEGVNPLILPIGADATQFEKSINEVKDRIKDLSSIIKSTPFNLVTQGQKDELAGLITTLDRLNDSVAKTSDQFNKSVGSSKNARTALTSLSLVAQDAPFGFIAIQNNLPAVISSFGELTKTSGGVKGALSQIGSALLGPAGLFLAFSAVTGAVTFAIQKYGSLGAAFDALIGNTNEFTDSIRKVNKELEEYNKTAKDSIQLRNQSLGSIENEIIKVNSLADVLRSSTASDRQKKGALAELKKANDEYFGKLNGQKIDLDALTESVAKYTESLIKTTVAQNLAAEAGKVFTEFLKQNQLAFDISEKINKLADQYPNLAERAKEYLQTIERIAKQGGTPFAPSEEVRRFIELNDQLKSVNKNVLSTATSYGTLKNQAQAAFKEASAFLNLTKDSKGGTGESKKAFKLSIDAPDLDEFTNLDKIIANLTKYGNALLDTSNSEKERKLALQKLLEINPEYFKGLSIEKKGLEQTKTSIEDLITQYKLLKSQREFDARASKLNAEFLKNQLKALEDLEKQAGKLQDIPNFEIDQLIDPSQFDKVFKGIRFVPKLSPEGLMIWDPIRKGAQLVQEEFTYVIKGIKNVSSSLKEGFKGLEIQTAIDEFASSFKTLGEVYDFTFKDIVEKNKEIASTIQGFLYQPLENVFDVLLSKGEKSWKEFGDAVIATIKRIAAQLLALTIAKGIANILAPGLKDISTGVLGEFLGGVRNPTFGGLEGGMQMNGQVVFVQRGSDLVGVLNRTNSTIGRIG